ncbi:hypothetical protein AB1Y20_019552 [Prymnesium parvum]|uniref:JmjC domain-containing protein n=1 Tax=Prymnesium parvum TaxID=97485 RepID=A0AB34JUP1_PRYPA
MIVCLLLTSALYPEVRPLGFEADQAYFPKRFKGNGLNTDFHLSGYSDQSRIVQLTPATFERALRGHKAVFVAFCMEGYGQVDGLLVEWGKLALHMAAEEPSVMIAKVDAVEHAGLAAKYRVEHYPTLTWFLEGAEVQQYPEDESRFASDLAAWAMRQLKPFGRLLPPSSAGGWAAAALSSFEIRVLGFFRDADDPLLAALRYAFLHEYRGSVEYTSDPAAYDTISNGLDLTHDGAQRPILLVKPFDERVVLCPPSIFDGWAGDDLVRRVQRWVKLHMLPRITNFQEEYQRLILERATYMPVLFAVSCREKLPVAQLYSVASELEDRLFVVSVDATSAEAAPLIQWLGLSPLAVQHAARSSSAEWAQLFGYAMRNGTDQVLYAPTDIVAFDTSLGLSMLRSFAEGVLDGTARTIAPTPPNPRARGPPLELQDLLPLPRPRRTLRACHVHTCEDGQFDPAATVAMGEHGEEHVEVEHHKSGSLQSADFYLRYMAGNMPVVIEGEAAAATNHAEWDDELFRSRCELPGRVPWNTLVELNKVVVRNDRWPLVENITMCDFIERYQQEEYKDKLYTITPINVNENTLQHALRVPPVVRCFDVWETVHEARLWMSSGNTSSSLHFDTHDNLLLQLDGKKTILLWPPSSSKNFYMDFHDRWGLSPMHVDRVDLNVFPLFEHTKGMLVATVSKGDAVLIPDGWWHQVRSHPGRNVAVTLEIEPHEGLMSLWYSDRRALDKYMDDRTAWWEKILIKRDKNVAIASSMPLDCPHLVPPNIDSSELQCGRDHAGAPVEDRACNWECMPGTCRVEALKRALSSRLGSSH